MSMERPDTIEEARKVLNPKFKLHDCPKCKDRKQFISKADKLEFCWEC